MMKKVLLPITISLIFGLSSASIMAETMKDSSHNWNSPVSASKQAISNAKAENKKATKLGFEWRDTGKMIKAAVELAAAGKVAEAIKLANKAKQQAIYAQKQAVDNKNAGPHLF